MRSLKVGIVVPHIFMQDSILPHVIFSPGELAIQLAEGLTAKGQDVTLFTPGPVSTNANNVTADLSLFQAELDRRGDTYMSLLKKHPFTFITLARQVQSELIAKAYALASNGEFDIVHMYTNEEDTALPFAQLCKKPVVFTHHDPFNFLVKYKSIFPKYKNLNWISMSQAQRQGMPRDTNWVDNVYHGLDQSLFKPIYKPTGNYVVFLGRIIEPKGLHLAIAAVKKYNESATDEIKLKIAGKHYADYKKDKYWNDVIAPELDDPNIEYLGYVKDVNKKQELIGNARALIMPSTFEEPFGMVAVESLACATPVIGLDSGAIPEVVSHKKTGLVVHKSKNNEETIERLAKAIGNVDSINREDCRAEFEQKFTLERMIKEHIKIYSSLI